MKSGWQVTIGIEETLKSFKEAHPDLFGSGTPAPPVDDGRGGTPGGTMTDDELRKLNGVERAKIKESDPALYNRIRKLASVGRQ